MRTAHLTRFSLLFAALALTACSEDSVTSADGPFEIRVQITTDKSSYELGDPITIRLKNTSERTVHVYGSCPPSLERQDSEEWRSHSLCDCACPAIPPVTAPLARGATISYQIDADQSREFVDAGTYRKHFRIAKEDLGFPEDFYSESFEVGP